MPLFITPNQTKADRLIAEFAQKDKPTTADFLALEKMGVMYDRLDRYRMEAMSMTEDQLKGENHKSRRLASNMKRAGDPRPAKQCDCHAIVSGGHRQAVLVRGVLAWLKMRIDDPHNGCWLPRDWDDRKHMPTYLRNAVPHWRIHHDEYYNWLAQMIRPSIIRTPSQLIQALRMVRSMLQSGNVPPNVLPQTGR